MSNRYGRYLRGWQTWVSGRHRMFLNYPSMPWPYCVVLLPCYSYWLLHLAFISWFSSSSYTLAPSLFFLFISAVQGSLSKDLQCLRFFRSGSRGGASSYILNILATGLMNQINPKPYDSSQKIHNLGQFYSHAYVNTRETGTHGNQPNAV